MALVDDLSPGDTARWTNYHTDERYEVTVTKILTDPAQITTEAVSDPAVEIVVDGEIVIVKPSELSLPNRD